MGVTLQNGKISVLKYAGDVVLIATEADVLQKALMALNNFVRIIDCFAKKRPTMLPIFYYGESQREWVTEFKYLGVTFSHRNAMVDGLDMSTLFRPKSEIHQETILCSTKYA